jgi:tight adherence protein B
VTSIEICHRLATLARAGLSPRQALIELPGRLEAADDRAISVARRAKLGYPLPLCLQPFAAVLEGDHPRLVRCLGSTAATGADWARELDELAEAIKERAARYRDASVAGAGATLSARTIAALPFLMLPIALKQADDPAVAICIALGLALGYAGYRWLVGIVPPAPSDDPMATLADELAAAVSAGLSLDGALREAASRRDELARAVRKVDLGGRWVSVLSTEAGEIGRAVQDAMTTGVPVETSLRRRAQEIRHRNAQAFGERVQRAPIRMVVPLVTCILPSFVLVAIVPLLRGLAQPV